MSLTPVTTPSIFSVSMVILINFNFLSSSQRQDQSTFFLKKSVIDHLRKFFTSMALRDKVDPAEARAERLRTYHTLAAQK